jgi:hypothetical protein
LLLCATKRKDNREGRGRKRREKMREKKRR